MERSGAAQGLAEVLKVLGRAHFEGLLPNILAACGAASPYVREGHLTLFSFLPHAIPDIFQVCMCCVRQGTCTKHDSIMGELQRKSRACLQCHSQCCSYIL